MIKKITFTFALAALFSAFNASAENIYVYKTGNYTPVIQMENVRSIAFTSTKLTLNGTNGSKEEVALSDINYFRLYKTPVPSAIKNAQTLGVKFSFDGNNVKVQSEKEVESAALIGANGTVIAKIEPKATSFTYQLSQLTKGMYLMKIQVGGESFVEKIIKK